MKRIITIIALAAAAAAQAQIINMHDGNAHAVVVPGTVKGYMKAGVPQYEMQFDLVHVKAGHRRVTYVVSGCFEHAPGKIIDTSDGVPMAWRWDGRRVLDTMGEEVCKAAAAWLQKGGAS